MHDVIVVGARCAGSALAMSLARMGHQVLVLDKDRFPSDMPMSTHLIHQRGVACLGRWGLRDEVSATGSLPVTRGVFDLGPVTLIGSPPAVAGETDSFAPRRLLLDAILVNAAVGSGAELREDSRVTGLLVEDGRVVGVRGVRGGGRRFAERARLVVGADGPASRVATAAGAARYHTRPALQTTAWAYWSGCGLEGFELHLGSYEGVYAFPSSNGSTLVGANWAARRFREVRKDLESSYRDLVRRLAPELAARLEGSERVEAELHVGSTRSYFREACGPGWALVGDAHYKKDPCTAQGITDAFCDAEDLAAAVDAGLSGRRDILDELKEHERVVVARAMPFYELTCEMATFAPPTAEQVVLYEALRDDPEAARDFIGMVTTAVSPADFFAPGHVESIVATGSG